MSFPRYFREIDTQGLDNSKLPVYSVTVKGTTKLIQAPGCHNAGDARIYVENLGYEVIKPILKVTQMTLSR